MPKVLRIINRFNLGGPTYNVAYLSSYLSPEFETYLLGGEKDETEDSSLFITQSLGLSPVIIPEMKRKISLMDDYRAYKKICAIIREFKPDIVHTHASKAGTIGRLAAHRCGVPVIIHTFHGHVFHSYFGKLSTLFYKTIERYLAGISTKIVAISKKQKQELSQVHKIAPEEKFTVIPLGFDLARFSENTEQKRKDFRHQFGLNDEVLVFGIIGRLVPIKNHKMFLSAISHLQSSGTKRFKAVVVGDGELKQELVAYAQSLGLSVSTEELPNKEATVVFTGWMKDADRALAGMDVVCLTSFNEGTPVSLIEAQAAGRPIVSTRVGGIEDVVQEGITALLCASDDTEAFASHLGQLLGNPVKIHEMSGRGVDFVKMRFTYTRLVEDTRRLYLQCLADNSPA